MGPLGIALGAVVGGAGAGRALVGRGLSQNEAQEYEADVMAGRYLVAVETERHSADEVRALLKVGVQQVQVHRKHTERSPGVGQMLPCALTELQSTL